MNEGGYNERVRSMITLSLSLYMIIHETKTFDHESRIRDGNLTFNVRPETITH